MSAVGVRPRPFAPFVSALARHWKSRMPEVVRIPAAIGPSFPKASTFTAGNRNRHGVHVILNLQHANKAWAVGEFTLNVALSADGGMPKRWLVPNADFDLGRDGYYRAGALLHGYDKWWCLLPPEIRREYMWLPASYQDERSVFAEAAADVTSDVEAVLRRLGHNPNRL